MPSGSSSKQRNKHSSTHHAYTNSKVHTSRHAIPIYSSESGVKSRGMGMSLRDADSSTRALLQLKRKAQELSERKRASGLVLLLVFVAFCVHMESRPVPLLHSKTDAKLGDSDGELDDSAVANISLGIGGTNATATMEDTRDSSIWSHLMDSLDRPIPNATSLFFHVPRNGGQTIKDIVGQCLSKVQASDVGVRNGHDHDPTLMVVEVDNSKYLNINVNSKPGIERAATLGCCDGGKHNNNNNNNNNNATTSDGNSTTPPPPVHADMVSTPYFLNAVKHLFSKEGPARAFVLMRNPMERAMSMYEYQRETMGLNVSLEDYAHGDGIENNWMVRFLTNAMEGELKLDHVTQAKKILSKKFLVGFLDDIEESIVRLMKYNGWEFEVGGKEEYQQECIAEKLRSHVGREHDLPKKGTQTHAYLSWQTQYDFKLYEFAKQLFEIQTKQYGSKERKKEMKRKKKEMEKEKEKKSS